MTGEWDEQISAYAAYPTLLTEEIEEALAREIRMAALDAAARSAVPPYIDPASIIERARKFETYLRGDRK